MRGTTTRRDEAGAAAMYVVLMTVALFVVGALVIDGGYTMAAKRQAINHAEQAARVGADALDEGRLRDGSTRVNPQAAVVAAQSYLAGVGSNGSVSVDGGEVTVVIDERRDTTLFSIVGVNSLPVHAEATAVSIDEDGP